MEGGICFGRGGLASILAPVLRFGCVATSIDRTLFYVGGTGGEVPNGSNSTGILTTFPLRRLGVE